MIQRRRRSLEKVSDCDSALGSHPDMITGICVEWAQSRARAARWDEEVKLLVEEMRRVLQFLRWKERWWKDQGEQRRDARSDVLEGLKAYAGKQASIMGQLARRFADEWKPVLMRLGLEMEGLHS
jgi:hypothetical protein